MGRPYHGNIMACRSAMARVMSHGFEINTVRWHNEATMREYEILNVFPVGSRLTQETMFHAKQFSHYDADVMLNEQTAWLNKLADELDYWQSKS